MYNVCAWLAICIVITAYTLGIVKALTWGSAFRVPRSQALDESEHGHACAGGTLQGEPPPALLLRRPALLQMLLG